MRLNVSRRHPFPGYPAPSGVVASAWTGSAMQADLRTANAWRQAELAQRQVVDLRDAIAEQKRWHDAMLLKVLQRCPEILQTMTL